LAARNICSRGLVLRKGSRRAQKQRPEYKKTPAKGYGSATWKTMTHAKRPF
jgi:hypothetical protein